MESVMMGVACVHLMQSMAQRRTCAFVYAAFFENEGYSLQKKSAEKCQKNRNYIFFVVHTQAT